MEKKMYQTIEGIAEYLEVDIAYVLYLIREKQISTITVDDEVLINRSQFDFFIKQRQKMIEEYHNNKYKKEGLINEVKYLLKKYPNRYLEESTFINGGQDETLA